MAFILSVNVFVFYYNVQFNKIELHLKTLVFNKIIAKSICGLNCYDSI
jgi:hypothetical protein